MPLSWVFLLLGVWLHSLAVTRNTPNSVRLPEELRWDSSTEHPQVIQGISRERVKGCCTRCRAGQDRVHPSFL